MKKIFIHEKYEEEYQKNNDIAILKLQKALIFNDNVKPACLPDTSVSYDAVGIASGWGDIDSKLFFENIPVVPGALKGKANIIYRTRAIITRGLYTFYPLFEVHLCTVTFGLMYVL